MLSALAHEHRVKIVRLLVKAGPSGVPSSEIANAVGISPTGASFHLKELDRAGLIVSARQGRFILYAIHDDGISRLLSYLTKDCCQGQPELCGDAFKKSKTMCS